MRLAAAAVISVSCFAATCLGSELDQVVASHYPSALTEYCQANELQEKRQQVFDTVQIGATKYVIAAYSNGAIGAAVLLEHTGGSDYKVDSLITTSGLEGSDPAVRMIDLDGDSVPEAVVSLRIPRGAVTVIYRI